MRIPPTVVVQDNKEVVLVRKLLSLAVVALALVLCGGALCGEAMAAPAASASPAVVPPIGGSPGWPSGCRDLDISTAQSSFLFHTTIYRLHALQHWCWAGGAIYEERHAWSFEGGSTACLNTVYPANAWFYTYWNGIGSSGHYTEERAHVTNCVFHIGDWKEFYPDVKIWVHADGSYTTGTSN
jgi:hypothetical protein